MACACVAGIEGNVHHCSRKRVQSLCAKAGFESLEQKVHRGPAPFLLTEAAAPPSIIPAPHFDLTEASVPATTG
jgi:hypothetical protein